LLGQGGCAEVYLGKHRYLNSYAALKVLHARLHSGDEQKFLAEAQTLVNLRHPNIVHLLDFGIENGTPVLIMDYAPKRFFTATFSPRHTDAPHHGRGLCDADRLWRGQASHSLPCGAP
jgi:serine/threonine protein kinase